MALILCHGTAVMALPVITYNASSIAAAGVPFKQAEVPRALSQVWVRAITVIVFGPVVRRVAHLTVQLKPPLFYFHLHHSVCHQAVLTPAFLCHGIRYRMQPVISCIALSPMRNIFPVLNIWIPSTTLIYSGSGTAYSDTVANSHKVYTYQIKACKGSYAVA